MEEESNEDIVRLANFNGRLGDNICKARKQRVYMNKRRWIVWQVVATFFASLCCLSFGLMIGWPSPMYPRLLRPTSAIPITMDQSAMIAGSLMFGNTLGTPISSSYHLGPKYGLIIGTAFMTIGWILMWQARNIYFLLGSRLLVGIGGAYAIGQLKNYIKTMTEDRITNYLIAQINLFIIFGIILGVAVGPFLTFRQFSLFGVILSIFVLFVCIFLPATPKELIKSGNIKDAHRLIKFLGPHLNSRLEIAKIRDDIDNPQVQIPFCDILKDFSLRKHFVILSLLIFIQQWSGPPATFVYTQIIFYKSGNPYPEYCAMLYVSVYFLIYLYLIFFSLKFNKKYVLICSSVSVAVLLVAIILVLYFDVNNSFWNYSFFILIILYLICHTIGLGYIPFTLIGDYFPKTASSKIVLYYVMVHSVLAIIITKVFQVLVDRFYLFVPFCLFLCISTLGILYVIIFVPNPTTSPPSKVINDSDVEQ